MRYILLLRGINVGGKNKVVMREFIDLLAAAGLEAPASYSNSGNLFFSSDDHKESCISKIRALLEKHYDFSVPFALLTKEEYLEERAALPAWWHGEMARKDVLFYACGMDVGKMRDFIEQAALYNEIVHVGRHAIFWGKYDEAEYLKTIYHKKLMKQAFYREVTIRSGNTYERIAEILENEK
ncbi:DUF1697 domain-containing protein [Stomatobaculum longum]|uniref:DUF1697 domain-containing protein n=1 Tax=Stomatobaculum longum TaxID=796942 RepID=UPI0028ECB35A|nr:DUF1697 domain-containing protein [Stomatobaculum longum]